MSIPSSPCRVGGLLSALFLVAILSSAPQARATEVLGARYPALSPDGAAVAFAWHGDIWIVSANGGTARRVTVHVADELRPLFSADGRRLVYASNRYGAFDIFVSDLDGSREKRLTFSSGNDLPTSISADGRYVIFQSNRENGSSIYRVPLAGGRVERLVPGFWNIVSNGIASPRSDELLFTTSYESTYFYWRKGYRGSWSSDIYRRKADGTLEVVVHGPENELWPLWGPNDGSFFFTSDRDHKTFNIFRAKGGVTPLTRFVSGHVSWPTIDRRGKTLVFSREFALWRIQSDGTGLRRLRIEANAAPKQNDEIVVSAQGKVVGFSLSPDGKKLAVVANGNIFVTSATGGYAKALTRSVARREELNWAPDSLTLYYISDEGGLMALYRVKADGSSKPERVVSSRHEVREPRISPDGKSIAYLSGKMELRVCNVDGSNDRLVARDLFGGRFADGYEWSPDSRFIAYTQIDRFAGEIFVVHLASRRRINLTRTGYRDFGPRFTADGKSIYFTTNRTGHKWPYYTGKNDIYLMPLTRRKQTFSEDAFDKLFRSTSKSSSETKKKPQPNRTPDRFYDESEIDKRLIPIARSKGDDEEPRQSPKNPRLFVYLTNAMGGWNLARVTLAADGKTKGRELLTRGLKLKQIEFHPSGKSVYALQSGRISRIDLASKKISAVNFDATISLPRRDTFRHVFSEVWTQLKLNFYDAKMHGSDWDGLRKRFLPLISTLETRFELVEWMNELVGYLNASHTSVGRIGGRKSIRPAGALGADFEPGGWRIARVLKNGPLDRASTVDLTGYTITGVDGAVVTSSTNLVEYLRGRIGKRTIVRVEKGGRTISLKVRPVTTYVDRGLRYQRWERQRKAIVSRLGGGRIGYVHLKAMGIRDFRKFYAAFEQDLAPKEGAIIDVRFNHGGNVHDLVLALLVKRMYARWTIRGMNTTPQPYYSLNGKPIVLLINEVTLSDGEMLANAFKELKLGTVIGNTTYGWLIFTTDVATLWGVRYRLPFLGCYTLSGKNLERQGGVTPDIKVIETPIDRAKGRDPQLEAAIQRILGRLPKRGARR